MRSSHNFVRALIAHKSGDAIFIDDDEMSKNMRSYDYSWTAIVFRVHMKSVLLMYM